MENNVDAAIPIGYTTLSNLLFVFFFFFKFYPLYSLKDVGMLVAIFLKLMYKSAVEISFNSCVEISFNSCVDMSSYC